MDTEIARTNMIQQQIRTWNVLDREVLETLEAVKREEFVPPAYRALTFVDMEIPLRPDAAPGENMLEPKVEARLLQALVLARGDRVLEIGAGSGYMAALLARHAAHVISFEIEPALADGARDNLQRAGIHNVDVRLADGAHGAPEDGPFDVIVLSGSVDHVPHAFFEQLKAGGRLAAIVGDEPVMVATLYTRGAGGAPVRAQPLFDTLTARLRNFPEPGEFRF